MNQIITKAIVLARTNYQEADRILTLLTPDHGKVRAMARGVRKNKSKLAGGIELFSISEIGYIHGKGELMTLTSARLTKHYGTIVQDIARTTQGYDFIKLVNKVTEDDPGPEYFKLLQQTLEALDNADIDLPLIQLWFDSQLLHLSGHAPNLHTDNENHNLTSGKQYGFDLEAMTFALHPDGMFGADHIKLLRLAQTNQPATLAKVTGTMPYMQACAQLANAMRKTVLHA